jgi:hypothetical protein
MEALLNSPAMAMIVFVAIAIIALWAVFGP